MAFTGPLRFQPNLWDASLQQHNVKQRPGGKAPWESFPKKPLLASSASMRAGHFFNLLPDEDFGACWEMYGTGSTTCRHAGNPGACPWNHAVTVRQLLWTITHRGVNPLFIRHVVMVFSSRLPAARSEDALYPPASTVQPGLAPMSATTAAEPLLPPKSAPQPGPSSNSAAPKDKGKGKMVDSKPAVALPVPGEGSTLPKPRTLDHWLHSQSRIRQDDARVAEKNALEPPPTHSPEMTETYRNGRKKEISKHEPSPLKSAEASAAGPSKPQLKLVSKNLTKELYRRLRGKTTKEIADAALEFWGVEFPV